MYNSQPTAIPEPQFRITPRSTYAAKMAAVYNISVMACSSFAQGTRESSGYRPTCRHTSRCHVARCVYIGASRTHDSSCRAALVIHITLVPARCRDIFQRKLTVADTTPPVVAKLSGCRCLSHVNRRVLSILLNNGNVKAPLPRFGGTHGCVLIFLKVNIRLVLTTG